MLPSNSSAPVPNRRRIVHVIDSLGIGGGAEQQLVANLRLFSAPRLEHTLVCLYRDPHETRETDLPAGVAVHYLYDREPGSRLATVARLDRLLVALEPSLIHCTLPQSALAARFSGRRLGVPVIESLVNISHEPIRLVDNPNIVPWKLWAHRLLDRATMRWVLVFHALSREVARSWSELAGVPLQKIRVIPRGVDLTRFDQDPREARSSLGDDLEIRAEQFVVVSIGRHEPQKGQLYLIEAMPVLLKSLPEAVLVLAGQPGSLTDRFRKRISDLNIGDSVRLLGRRRDVPTLLRAADAFVFPSLFEGLGVSLLEAMAAGLPTVSTDRAPMNEIVSNEIDGLLVPERNSQRLANALIRLAGDPGLRARLGSAARSRVEEGFNIERSARAIEALYLEVLNL
ncbi:MAG: glycosyltransferase family 4 protein [Acidimicrobiia bacterium]